MYKFIVILTATLLAGCNSTDEDLINCKGNNNWHQIGLDFASLGKTVRSHEQYLAECGIKLTEVEQEAYLSGYYVGLNDFCTYEKGKEFGSKGLQFPIVCPYELRETIQAGYDVGAREYLEKRKKLARDDRLREQRGMQTESNSASQGR